jgi:quercetin dioxygenase-like cupin family protein
VVLNGRGRLTAGPLAIDVQAGDTIGVPAAIAPEVLLWPHETLELIACRPPRVDLLEAVDVALDARAG